MIRGIEGKGWHFIKPSPLPTDGAEVEWIDSNGAKKRGVFFSESGMFMVPDPDDAESALDFDYAEGVECWRYTKQQQDV